MSSKILVNAVVAVVAAAAGYAIYTGVFAKQDPVAGPSTEVVAPPAAAVAATAGEAGIPQVLPDFTLADRDGAKRSIRSWTGKSMVVNFWATWCGPCRKEIPLLKEMQKAHSAAGFQIVGVAVDDREAVLKYATEIGIDYPILVGEEDGMQAVTSFGLGSIGFPFTVFTDNQQRIVVTHLGEISKPQFEIFVAAVDSVNGGKASVAAARTAAALQIEALPHNHKEG